LNLLLVIYSMAKVFPRTASDALNIQLLNPGTEDQGLYTLTEAFPRTANALKDQLVHPGLEGLVLDFLVVPGYDSIEVGVGEGICDLSPMSSDGQLMSAFIGGHMRLVSSLLGKTQPFYVGCELGWACAGGNVDIALYFLTGDVNLSTDALNKALLGACRANSPDCIQLLAELVGFDGGSLYYGPAIIHSLSTKNNSTEVIKLLVKLDAGENGPQNDRIIPVLNEALGHCCAGHPHLVGLILELGATECGQCDGHRHPSIRKTGPPPGTS
jgi:hypothetical protein